MHALCACWVLLSIASGVAAQFVFARGTLLIDGDSNNSVVLKGVNYYPKDHPWAAMWDAWDWPQISAEIEMLAALKFNVVRILVPYSQGGWGGPAPPPDRLAMLYTLVNAFGSAGLRSIVTLFDWETTWPVQSSALGRDHLAYLTAIVTPFASNPNVLAWDIKNEPDHPNNIGGGDDWDSNPHQRDIIVAWLNWTTAAVHTLDHNHLVSTGLRWWTNARAVIDTVDTMFIHSYWPDTASRRLPDLHVWMLQSPRGLRPLVVEEFGWPSDGAPQYTPEGQLAFYQAQLPGFAANNVSGAVQWMAFDIPGSGFESFFGLWNRTGQQKAVARYFADFPLRSPLPFESSHTNVAYP